MKLIWNGHSCFTVQAREGTLVLDPYADGFVPGLPPLRLEADRVLCSHGHGDHNAAGVVSLTGRPCAIGVETVDTFHDEVRGAKRGSNIIHILSAEGLRVVHCGDLGCALEPEQLARLAGADALLVPVGGYYTIDARQAQALVEAVRPRVVVPMHYRGDGFGLEVLSPVDEFLSLRSNVVRYPDSVLELTADTPAQTAVLACPRG